jgi:23S rRNA G2069 N7-methylase RlmK/C1962 C5-methylase RlmI
MHPDDVLAAVRRRASMDLCGPTDVLRLVDDAGDAGCEGLIVDRYGLVLRIEVKAQQLPRDIGALARAIAAESGAQHAVALTRSKGAHSALTVVLGDPPHAHVVHERGARLLVRLTDPDAAGTGVFVDHREGRALVREAARGKSVLNLFAHAGAFGAAAVCGGASRVDHVDAAKKCAPWAALNLALNGVDPRAHRFVVDDALVFAGKQKKKGVRYGVVICDPPTTALRPDGSRFHVEKDLAPLASTLVDLVEPGGALLLSTNNRELPLDDVLAIATDAARAARRPVTAVREVPLPPDVTTRTDRLLRPMRGAWVTFARGST